METSHLTFLFFQLAFGLKSGDKHHMLERARLTLSSVFCANPCKGLSGVCRLEQDVSVHEYQQEMREVCKRCKRRKSSSSTGFRA